MGGHPILNQFPDTNVGGAPTAKALQSSGRQMIRAFLTVFSGSSAAQMFSILLVPFVTRLFTPEHYGQVALVFSIAVFLSMLCSLGYNNAVLLPDSEVEALQLFSLSAFVLAVFTALLLPFCLAGTWLLSDVGVIAKLGNWIFAIPLTLLLLGGGNLLQVLNIRNKNYRSIAGAEITSGIATPGTRIAFGYLSGSTLYGLVAGMLIGLFLRAWILIVSLKTYLRRWFQWPERAELVHVAKTYRDFPQLFLPNVLLNALSLTFPIIILSQYFSSEIVGFYAMAERLIKMPLNVVADSVQKILVPAFAEKKAAGLSLLPLFNRSFFFLFAVGLPPLIAFVLFGEYLLTLFLSVNWQMAGRFGVLLIPVLFSEYIHRPAVVVFLVLRRQDIRLRLQIVKVLITMISLVFGSLFFLNAEKTILTYSLLVALSNASIIILGFLTAHKWDRQDRKNVTN